MEKFGFPSSLVLWFFTFVFQAVPHLRPNVPSRARSWRRAHQEMSREPARESLRGFVLQGSGCWGDALKIQHPQVRGCCPVPTPSSLRLVGSSVTFEYWKKHTNTEMCNNKQKLTGINGEIKSSRHFCHTHLACFLIPVSLFFPSTKSQFLAYSSVWWCYNDFFLRTSPFGIFVCVVSLFCEENMPASETESHLVTKYTDSLNEVVDLLCRWGSPWLLSVGQLWFV